MNLKTSDYLLLMNGAWLAGAWCLGFFYPNAIFAWFDLRIFTLIYLLLVIYVLLKNNK